MTTVLFSGSIHIPSYVEFFSGYHSKNSAMLMHHEVHSELAQRSGKKQNCSCYTLPKPYLERKLHLTPCSGAISSATTNRRQSIIESASYGKDYEARRKLANAHNPRIIKTLLKKRGISCVKMTEKHMRSIYIEQTSHLRCFYLLFDKVRLIDVL